MATTFCTKCGSPGEGAFCADCGQARDPALAPAEHIRLQAGNLALADAIRRSKERHGVPALLSFFIPGLGQMVKGEILSGLVVMVAMFVSAMLTMFVIGVPMLVIFWVWQLYDAYTAPDAATRRELKQLSR